jgi:hypothetical protein
MVGLARALLARMTWQQPFCAFELPLNRRSAGIIGAGQDQPWARYGSNPVVMQNAELNLFFAFNFNWHCLSGGSLSFCAALAAVRWMPAIAR